MKKYVRKTAAVLLALLMVLNGFMLIAEAAQISVPAAQTTGAQSDNASENQYTFWSKPINSYLMENKDGSLTRVEYTGNGLIAETYAADGKTILNRNSFLMELPIFGGFYCGSTYNYFVFGKENPEESDRAEVIRIVKYSKDWTRISAASIAACNTTVPFDAGVVRFAETNGLLYLYTCHEMYADANGYHHQSNMTFVVNEESMQVEQSFSGIMNIAQAGYVSHSFNQFIQTDGEYVYRVDHGDSHMRGISVTRCAVEGSIRSVTYAVPIVFDNANGRNATGASVGGFELTAQGCMIAGNLIDYQAENAYYTDTRNIFLNITSTDLATSKTVWLTNYPKDHNVTICTPQLVKINENCLLVLWEEGFNGPIWVPNGNGASISYPARNEPVVTKMVLVDAAGNTLSDIAEAQVRLSDCQPIVCSDGTVKWYVTEQSAPVIYSVDPQQLYVQTPTVPPTTVPPTTAAPTTVPPITAAPTTAAPTTAAPTTAAPTTAAPTTAAPTTATPTTVAPTTVPPTTAAPTTVPPTTAAPTTVPPTTAAPTTAAPTTAAPTTATPTTATPTTVPPTTATPTTVPPTTAAPTTATPTTVPPTTATPTTVPPTTAAPTTVPPTTVPNHTSSILPGDMDGNGKINSSDARTILRASAKIIQLTDAEKIIGDINGDSRVNSADARIVLRIAAKIETVDAYLPAQPVTVPATTADEPYSDPLPETLPPDVPTDVTEPINVPQPTEEPTAETSATLPAIDSPTKPAEQPTEPTEQPTEPAEQPTEPAEQPTEPAEQPTEPTEQPTEPTEQPTEPTEQPTEPTEQPTEPTEQPTEPSAADMFDLSEWLGRTYRELACAFHGFADEMFMEEELEDDRIAYIGTNILLIADADTGEICSIGLEYPCAYHLSGVFVGQSTENAEAVMMASGFILEDALSDELVSYYVNKREKRILAIEQDAFGSVAWIELMSAE